MTEQKDTKDTVLKQVRSILLPEKYPVSCDEFLKSWGILVGYPFPYKKLGYATPQDFLLSIPDVVTTTWERNHLMLKAIPTESTKHIARMVACQKPKVKKFAQRRPPMRQSRYGFGTGFSSYSTRNNRPPPPQPGFYNNNNNNAISNGNARIANQNENLPVLQPIQRGQIKELLRAFPNGIVGVNFNIAFTRRFGQMLSYKTLGFANLHELFRSIPDVVELQDLESGGYKILSRESSDQRKGINVSQNRSASQKQELPPRLQRKRDAAIQRQAESSNGTDTTQQPDERQESQRPARESPEDLLAQTKHRIEKILNKNKDGIKSSVFSTMYRTETGQELRLNQLGYHSVIDLMSSLTDIVTIRRHGMEDWILYDARVAPPPNTGNHQVGAQPLSEILRRTLLQVITQHPNGLNIQDIPHTYRTLTGLDLDLRKLGQSSVESVIDQMSDIVYKETTDDGGTLVKPVNNSEPPRDDLLLNQQHETPTGVPQDAVGPGNTYKHLPLPNEMFDMFVDVFVCHIDSPGRFWMQLKGGNTTEALETLMDQLDNFYNNPVGDLYKMPPSILRVGLVAVALFPEDNNWHRIAITGIKDLDFIEAYFVDYGTSCAVPKASLRLLCSRFLSLPAQAIRAKLSNILPVDRTRWTRGSSTRLHEICSFRPVKALATHVDQEHTVAVCLCVGPTLCRCVCQARIVSVCLCDTSGMDDLHVNDLLVDEHYAVVDQPSPPTSPQPTPDQTSDDAEGASSHPAPQSVPLHCTAAHNGDGSNRSESSSEYETRPINVKFVELHDNYSLHLIKLNEKYWALSNEVSCLLGDKDKLRVMIRRNPVKLNKCIISEETHADLYDEFQEYDIPGICEEDGSVTPHLALYHIDSVVTILERYQHPPCEELIRAVKEQADNFDPNDPYWMGEEVELTVDELELGIQMLTHKRKKTLLMMRTLPANEMQTHVEEIGQIEEQLRAMNIRLKRSKQGKDAENAASKLTPQDNIVSKCIADQNDGYKKANQESDPTPPTGVCKPTPQPKSSTPPQSSTTTPPTFSSQLRPPPSLVPPPDSSSLLPNPPTTTWAQGQNFLLSQHRSANLLSSLTNPQNSLPFPQQLINPRARNMAPISSQLPPPTGLWPSPMVPGIPSLYPYQYPYCPQPIDPIRFPTGGLYHYGNEQNIAGTMTPEQQQELMVQYQQMYIGNTASTGSYNANYNPTLS